MKRVFITGMSGTGKTSAIEELRSRGYTAIDTDEDGWCERLNIGDKDEWLLREDRLLELLTVPSVGPLFVSGCCANQKKFYHFFDHKILLSAPLPVMLERVARRTTNPYDKSDEERGEILLNYEYIQPLLQKSADFEIDSSLISASEIADFLADLALS